MSKLADLHITLENARKVLGRKNSFAWQIFGLVNGKSKSTEIARTLKKQKRNRKSTSNIFKTHSVI